MSYENMPVLAGHDAAFQPYLPMYEFEQSPESTVSFSHSSIRLACFSFADCFTSSTRALWSKIGMKRDLTAYETCVAQANKAELFARKTSGPKLNSLSGL